MNDLPNDSQVGETDTDVIMDHIILVTFSVKVKWLFLKNQIILILVLKNVWKIQAKLKPLQVKM